MFADVSRNDLLFALAFNSEYDNREAAFNSLNSNNPATSCTNLEFTLLKLAFFAAIRPQFDDDLHSSPWRSETDWRSQFWFQKSNRQSFLYILYKFGEIRFSDSGSLRHKKLYSWRRKFFWGDFRYVQYGAGILPGNATICK